MHVAQLRRYPVKSMLGEELSTVAVTEEGLVGDRRLALLDLATGRVASAKQPRLWRALLRCAARTDGDDVRIDLPEGATAAESSSVDQQLTALLGRPVTLARVRPAGAEVERPDPEDVLQYGIDADVPFATLEIGQAAKGTTFVDYAPVHLITTATLDHLGIDPTRYRPNVVVTTDGGAPFAENDWVDHDIGIGDVVLRAVLPTPRCAVPTLEHGDLPRRPEAVRRLLTENRIDVPGFGVLPCAGVYATVVEPGTLRIGQPVALR